MKIKNIVSLIFLLGLLSSCVKELDYPQGMTESPKLVVDAYFVPFEPLSVSLKIAQSPANPSPFKVVSEAFVLLLDSIGSPIEQLSFNANTATYNSSFLPIPNAVYRIIVADTLNGFYCTGSDKTPAEKPRFACDTSTVFFQGKERFFQFNVILSDDPEADNYYSFLAKKNTIRYIRNQFGVIIDSLAFMEWVDLSTNDFWFNRNENKQYAKKQLMLVDNGFKGLVAFLKFGTHGLEKNNPDVIDKSITLFVTSHSADHFAYINSLSQHLLLQNDPFSQPNTLFSNLNGANGIFAARFVDSIRFDLAN
jgi:hypothetical protein